MPYVSNDFENGYRETFEKRDPGSQRSRGCIRKRRDEQESGLFSWFLKS